MWLCDRSSIHADSCRFLQECCPLIGTCPGTQAGKYTSFPPACSLGRRGSSVINMNLSRRGFFPSLSVTASAGSLMDLCHHFWMMFAFHFYFFISLSRLCLHLSSAAARAVLSRKERHLWNHPWKCAVLGSLICIMISSETTVLHRPAVSRESDQPVIWYTWFYRSLKNISDMFLILHANKIMCHEIMWNNSKSHIN